MIHPIKDFLYKKDTYRTLIKDHLYCVDRYTYNTLSMYNKKSDLRKAFIFALKELINEECINLNNFSKCTLSEIF